MSPRLDPDPVCLKCGAEHATIEFGIEADGERIFLERRLCGFVREELPVDQVELAAQEAGA